MLTGIVSIDVCLFFEKNVSADVCLFLEKKYISAFLLVHLKRNTMPQQAVGKALREREQALLTLHALEAELRRKRRGIGSLEQEGSQVRARSRHMLPAWRHAAHLAYPVSISHKI